MAWESRERTTVSHWTPNLKWDGRICGKIIGRLFLSRPQGNIFLHEGQVRLKFLTKIKR